MASKRQIDLLGLAFWLVLTFGVAFFGSQFEPGAWYQTISKPDWTPPGWVFGPVWTLLYLMMAVAAWLIWRRRAQTSVYLPLGLYIAQLLLNGLWSWFFFGRQMIGLALIDLLLLVVMVFITLVVFIRLHRWAGILLVPYLLWVCFASALNYEIFRLN
jgi:tryptophan-rich sensory protein